MPQYKLVEISVPPLTSGSGAHNGTGAFSGSKNLVVPSSVARGISEQLEFKYVNYSVNILSFAIRANVAPNWFGVGFRTGIRSLRSVNIFCHPYPAGAGMTDKDYPTRSGAWPRLFRYVEMLTSQLAVAESDQVLVVPFFDNRSYESTGIFGANWADLMTQILTRISAKLGADAAKQRKDPTETAPPTGSDSGKPAVAQKGVRKAASNAAQAALAATVDHAAQLNNVVLSDFSRGRALMWVMRKSSAGLAQYLREVWDFDGTGGAPPYTDGGVTGILYDQRKDVRESRSFHAPPERWVKFHKTVVANVHANIPDMMAWHAASISGVK